RWRGAALTRDLSYGVGVGVSVSARVLCAADSVCLTATNCGFARDLSRQNRLLSPGRLEHGSCLSLTNCLPAGGVQAPRNTVAGSRNRSQILFAQKKIGVGTLELEKRNKSIAN